MTLPIGGFMPIPLAMMIPFMAVQSIVMGDAFGMAYQYGKRKISSMTNEEFNTVELSDLISKMQKEFKQSIPSIKQSIEDSSDLQTKIINEMLLILPKFATQPGFTEAGAETGKVIAETLEPLTSTGTSGTNTQPYTGIAENFILALAKALGQPLNLPKAYGQTTQETNITQGLTEGPPDLRNSPLLNTVKYTISTPNPVKQATTQAQLKTTVKSQGQSATVIFSYNKQKGQSSYPVTVAMKGNITYHIRQLNKWRRDANNNQYSQITKNFIKGRIQSYLTALIKVWPNDYRKFY